MDEDRGISCLLCPVCSDKRSLHPRKPGKYDECLRSCLPTTSYPSKGELGNTGGNIPKIPQASSKVRLSICSNYWIHKLNGNTSLSLATTHRHGGTQRVPGRHFLIKQGCTKMPGQPGASPRNPGISTQRSARARVKGGVAALCPEMEG